MKIILTYISFCPARCGGKHHCNAYLFIDSYSNGTQLQAWKTTGSWSTCCYRSLQMHMHAQNMYMYALRCEVQIALPPLLHHFCSSFQPNAEPCSSKVLLNFLTCTPHSAVAISAEHLTRAFECISKSASSNSFRRCCSLCCNLIDLQSVFSKLLT